MKQGDNGLKEFQANLRRVKNLSNQQIKIGLEVSANEVVKHMQGKHQRGKNLSRAEVKAHPSERFYTWSNVLVNSMQAGDVVWEQAGAEIAVKAVAPYAEYVEAPKPGSGHRAFPFMGPAIDEFRGKFLKTLAKHVGVVFR